MTLTRLTPWARDRLTPAGIALIRAMEPLDAVATLGYSKGWTARINYRGTNGAVFGCRTPMAAVQLALADLERKAAHA